MHRNLVFAALAALSLPAAAAVAGCGGQSDVAIEGPQAPPPSPLVHAPPETGTFTPVSAGAFAITSMDLGSSSPTAWQQIGLDLDGVATTSSSLGSCALVPGTPTETQADGVGGIDNSLGENLLPILLTILGSDLNQATNASLARGGSTNVIAVNGGGTATLLVAAPAASSLGQDGGVAEGGVFPEAGTPRATDDAAPELTLGQVYLAGGSLVAAGSQGDGELVLGIPSMHATPLTLPITRVQIVAPVDPSSGSIVSGTIAGIMPTDALVAAMRAYLAREAPLESADVTAAILTMIEQASDILVSGENDPTAPCDAVSFAVQFTAEPVTVIP